jgi:hypothetical protein
MPGQLAGLRILRGVRVSTSAQRENWSVVEQESELDRLLEHEGAEIIPFDEQAVSGRDLGKRRALRRELDKLKRKEADGLAYYDVKRLTRSELNIDGGLIARELIAARAILVTKDRTYRLWLEDDLMAFQFQCFMSGLDVRNIRRTFWRGLMSKVDAVGDGVVRPFQVGPTPIGYTTEQVEERDSRGRVRVARYLIKDPEAADLMVRIGELLDAAQTLGEVTRALNAEGWVHPRARPKVVVTYQWRTQVVRGMLENPLYRGVWKFGRNSDGQSPVWAEHSDKRLEHLAPELAYWTPEHVAQWRWKFSQWPGADKPRSRVVKRLRPLTGVLACKTCGQPMIASGGRYYRCRSEANGSCPKPQVIEEHQALKDLRALLPQLRDDFAGARTEAHRLAAERRADVSELTSQLSIKEQQSSMASEGYARMLADGRRNEQLERQLDRWQQEVESLRVRIAEITADDTINPWQAFAEALDTHLDAILASRTDEQLAAVYRLLLTNVRIHSRGSRYRHVDQIEYQLRGTQEVKLSKVGTAASP